MSVAVNTKVTMQDFVNANRDLAPMGYLVVYRIDPSIEVSQLYLQVEAGLRGLESYVPDLPTDKVAMERAVRDWLKSNSHLIPNLNLDGQNDNVSADVETGAKKQKPSTPSLSVIDREHEDDWMGFVLTRKNIDLSAFAVSHKTEMRVFLNTKTREVVVSTAPSGQDFKTPAKVVKHPEIADALSMRLNKYSKTFIAPDLKKMVRLAVSGLRGVSVRSEGGTYIVPVSCGPQITALAELVKKLSILSAGAGVSYVTAYPLPDGRAARDQFKDAVWAGLVDEIKLAEAEMAAFDREAKDKTLHHKTIEGRVKLFTGLMRKINEHGELLGERLANLTTMLDKVKDRAGVLVDFTTFYDPNTAVEDYLMGKAAADDGDDGFLEFLQGLK